MYFKYIFHLNHVGYKAILPSITKSSGTVFHLNHVGYKAGDAALKAANEMLENSKPYPLASEAKQEGRSNKMRQTVERETKENFKNKN